MAETFQTTDEIGADLGLTRQGVWWRIRALKMKPAKKVGGAAVFSAAQVKQIAAAGEKKPAGTRGG